MEQGLHSFIFKNIKANFLKGYPYRIHPIWGPWFYKNLYNSVSNTKLEINFSILFYLSSRPVSIMLSFRFQNTTWMCDSCIGKFARIFGYLNCSFEVEIVEVVEN